MNDFVRFFVACGLLLYSTLTFGVEVTLHINKGEIQIDEQVFTATAFNASEELNAKNEIIILTPGEVHTFVIFNNDTLAHDLTIPGVLISNNNIEPGTSESFDVEFPQEGAFSYFSSSTYGKYCGAFGVIHVRIEEGTAFYWNLFDLNTTNSLSFANTELEEYPEEYLPELFLINGTFFPHTLEDQNTLVTLNLGETCEIVVANGGYMDHVLHFHGFHVTVKFQSGDALMLDWSKDTVPIKAGETMVLELTANLAGIYPVHDHNLIAVTNAGFYPGGMLTQIHVAE